MKKVSMIVLVILSFLFILNNACAEEKMIEEVSVLEIHGYMAEILLNKADKKSASDSEKTKYFTGAGQKGSLKSAERYKAQPWAVSITYAETTRQAEILFRSPETQLENANQGFQLIRRGLSANGKRCDLEDAAFLFQARLDKEGRKYDFIDFVVKIDGQVMSITHINVTNEIRNYYVVVGDARKGDPKPPKNTTTKQPTNTGVKPNPEHDGEVILPPSVGSGDTGSGDTGSGDTGSDDTGSGDTGSGDTGSGDSGSGDTGSGDTGSGDTGSGDTGSGDTGSGDTGSGDSEAGKPNQEHDSVVLPWA